MNQEKLTHKLSKYIHPAAAEIIAPWVLKYDVELKVKSARKTKLGDYRPPFDGKGHRISINANLNPHSFLITLVHEFAHLATHVHESRHVKPHGHEWKQWFANLLKPFLEKGLFPEDVTIALHKHLKNPPAASCADENLQRVLLKYNPDKGILLSEIPMDAVFQTKNGKVMIKMKLLRKRYLCKEIKSNRLYTVSGMMEVLPVKNN